MQIESAEDFSFTGAKADLILDMCTKLKADTYIFGKQGRGYADPQTFLNSGIVPIFQNYKYPVYPQLYGQFASYLSIVDLIFNCGDDSLDILMSQNVKKLAG